MDYSIKCNICRQWKVVTVDESEFADWQRGMVIQRAMPKISADDRELLVSGTCGTCFDKMFPDEDEELDDSFRIIDEANGESD